MVSLTGWLAGWVAGWWGLLLVVGGSGKIDGF